MLGKTFTQPALAALAGAGRATSSPARVARAQGGARSPGRSALARARPVRLPPGPRPPRRLRDAREARAASPPPGRGRPPEQRVRRRRGRGRRGDRVALPRCLRGRSRRRGRGRDQGEGASDARAGRRPLRVARCRRGGEPLLRAGGGARRRLRPSRRRSSTGRARWPRGQAIPTRRARCSSGRSRCTRRRATAMGPRGSLWGLGRLERTPATVTRRSHGWSSAFEVISADEPDQDSPSSRRGSRSPTGSAAISSAAESPSWRWTSPRRTCTRRRSSPRSAPRRASLHSRGHARESEALFKQSLQIALEHDLVDNASVCYFGLSDRCFQRDQYAGRARVPRRVARAPRRVGSRPREWAVVAERTYLLYMPGRWDEALADRRGVHRRTDPRRRRGSQPARTGVAIHLAPRKPRWRTACPRHVRAPRAIERRAGPVGRPVVAGIAAPRRGAAPGRALPTVRRRSRRRRHVRDRLPEPSSRRSSTRSRPPPHWATSSRPTSCSRRSRRFLRNPPAVPRRPGEEVPGPSGRRRRRPRRGGGQFRALGLPFWLAVTLLEHAELLAGRDLADEAEPLLADARGIFEDLQAQPWLDRAAGIYSGRSQVPA